MRKVPILTGPQVILRPPRASDPQERLALGRDPVIIRMFGGDTRDLQPMTHPEAAAWCDRLDRHPQAWVIEHDGRLLGEARLDNLEEHDRRATLAIGLYDPDKLGRGLGSQALRLILDHAFGTLGLHRIGLRVIAYNERAIRCYRKVGFVIEGRERDAALVDGLRHDDIIMGLLAQDYRRHPG